ncbi:MAG TPA: LXG domain-containing protein [Candidatus Avamphibacillus sp.]|nr:LXG domain-containing protein [Candidatus Avamphibacillus sp.]
MKVLDVSHVNSGIDDAIVDIDSFHEQISAIQRAVRDFHALDDALKGKGGEAIRTFFNEVHQPFLIYLYQSMVDYKNTLTEMKDATESFESHPSGFVSQEFLEQDVTDGFDKVKNVTTELTDEANSIIERVQDLVSVKKIDPSEVMDTVRDGKKKAEGIVEALSTLDDHETSQLEKTKEDLQMMRNYISEVASKFKSGDLSVSNYDIDTVKNIDAYKAITDEVYGEGYADSVALEPLFEKLSDGQSLTADERGKLYDYLQHVYLDSENRSEIKTIADSINEDGIDKLKERLNEKVIISKDALEEEMVIIHAYLYLGNKIPSETKIDNDTRARLEAYLILLNNYHSTMEEDIVITVDKLEYEKNHEDIPGHYIFSALQTAEYNVHEDIMDKQKFREWIFDPDNFTANNYSLSEITYYTGTNAAANHISQEIQDLKDKQANYTADFITKKVAGVIISKVASIIKIGDAVNVAKSTAEYQSGETKLEREITVNDAQNAAIRLDLEFAISNNRSIPASSEKLEVQLYPKDKTFNILARWQEVHTTNPEISYPKEFIQSQDWYKINEKLYDVELEYGSDLIDYIIDGTLSGEKTVDDIAKGIE